VASQAAAFLYGLAIVLVVLFEPAGLAGLAGRVRQLFHRSSTGDRTPTRQSVSTQPQEESNP
jgi:branched-chain amino acid transport system permease protein